MYLLGDPMSLLGLNQFISPQLLTLLYTLGFGGLITSSIYYLYSLVWEWVERSFTTSVTVESSDPVYKWLL
jgi:BCS1 N terminal